MKEYRNIGVGIDVEILYDEKSTTIKNCKSQFFISIPLLAICQEFKINHI